MPAGRNQAVFRANVSRHEAEVELILPGFTCHKVDVTV